ncbi:MAG: transcriptional regulator, ArsR family [Firmicutes bacterium]|nr:transcriptional regulator, ArsR family [Bacillota bacterium]
MDSDFTKYTEIAELLKVLAHPVRLCIVRGLLTHGECNVSHMQHCLSVPQSTISQHLQRLRTAGIIEGTRNGLEIKYALCNKKVSQLLAVLFETKE